MRRLQGISLLASLAFTCVVVPACGDVDGLADLGAGTGPDMARPPDLAAAPLDLPATAPDLAGALPQDLSLVPPDMAAPIADLSMVDMANSPGDFAVTPDLAVTADLAVTPDLATAPDLGGGGDMVSPGGLWGDLQGIWLIGWSGGLNHYSWVRFGGNPAGGPADVLPPMGNGAWIGFWGNCTGAGQWTLVKPDTITIKLPQNCNLPDSTLTFLNIGKPMGGWPPTAILEADFMGPAPPAPMNGWKFPANQCDAQYTKCTLP